MKKLALILTLLLVTGCSPVADIREATPVSLKAVYFIQKEARISFEDLQAHPEIVVVKTFAEFKQYASQKIALWIDKSATPFNPEQQKWINEAPQAYYPIVLVGTSDTLYAFRDLLGLCCFMGPTGDYPGYDATGFSVIQWKEMHEPDSRTTIFLQSYHQKPTVEALLTITNALLEGRLSPTPPVMLIPVTTVTMVQYQNRKKVPMERIGTNFNLLVVQLIVGSTNYSRLKFVTKSSLWLRLTYHK